MAWHPAVPHGQVRYDLLHRGRCGSAGAPHRSARRPGSGALLRAPDDASGAGPPCPAAGADRRAPARNPGPRLQRPGHRLRHPAHRRQIAMSTVDVHQHIVSDTLVQQTVPCVQAPTAQRSIVFGLLVEPEQHFCEHPCVDRATGPIVPGLSRERAGEAVDHCGQHHGVRPERPRELLQAVQQVIDVVVEGAALDELLGERRPSSRA